MKIILAVLIIVLILFLPINLSSLIIVDGKTKLIYCKIYLYKIIPIKTDKIDFNSFKHLKINDEEKTIELDVAPKIIIFILKKFFHVKIIDYLDVGLLSENCNYLVLAYNVIINNYFNALKSVDSSAKLNYYITFNHNKSTSNYCSYSNGNINLISILIIIIYIFKEKINERKQKLLYRK